MLKNYLKIAARKLWREKSYAFLNILGLTVGIAVSLLIFLFVIDEFSYDSFFTHSDRIYRVQFGHEFGGREEVENDIPEMIGPALESSYPDVEESARISGPYDRVLIGVEGERYFEKNVIRSPDAATFQLFDYQAISGRLGPEQWKPGSVVLTKSIAEKYFGTAEAAGEAMTVDGEARTVTAVIEDLPHNTHLSFVMVDYREPRGRRVWNYRSYKTYLLLSGEGSAGRLRQQFPDFIRQNAYRSTGEGVEKADPGKYSLYLQPLTEIHLDPRGHGSLDRAGPLQYIYIFITAALLVLGIACINYMNIATARSARQAREVGVRKTVGARRSQLVTRFLAESMLSSLLATALAAFIIYLYLPSFSGLVGKKLSLAIFDADVLVLSLLGVALLIGLLSGSYGAVVMSSFKPSTVLRGAPVKSGSGAGFRKTLVVFQFIASIGLILITVVIYQQMEFVRESRLDANDDEIVILQNYERRMDKGRFNAFRQRLLSYPEIRQVATGHIPGNVFSRAKYQDSTGSITEVHFASAGYGYADLLGLDITKGRDFSPEVSDSNAVLLNKSAADWLGVKHADGQKVRRANGRVVGIVEDFHMLPMYQPIRPMIIRFSEQVQRQILIKLKGNQISGGLDRIRATWNRFLKDQPILYSFLDEELDKAYKSELRMARIFGGFSGIAIFLACLGLFGLSAYSAHQRIREIGIRKVFGATIPDLVNLLSKDFIKLVLIGYGIAIPLSYYFIRRWLMDFQYKIDLGPGLFLLTGLAVLLIAVLTVSWQSVRAALTNPAETLRNE